MFYRACVRRFLCLVLSLLLTFEPLILAAEQASGEPQEEAFSVDQALSPGEYLKNIKELRGENREEIEKRSWADWATLMANVYLLMDPNAIDAPSFQNALGATLEDAGKVTEFSAALPDRIEKVANVLTWGSTHFGKVSPKLAGFSTKLLKNWSFIATKVAPKLDKFTGFCEFMHTPGDAGEAEAFQQWLKKKPPTTEGLKPLTKAQGAAMVVGTVIQILQGIAEIKSFFDAKADDPGAASFATVQHAITGTVLIACAIMALIPPPGVWMVVAAVVSAIWDTMKAVFEKVGEKIAQWHKAYEDSLTFLKETDREFSAFLSANNEESVFKTGQEKSAALNLADKMKKALDENPGEGEVAERQKELVKNIRHQGLLTTYYYQQATATSDLPGDMEELLKIWNHRADYMTWKPKKVRWSLNPMDWGDTIGDVKDYAVDWTVQEVAGTEDQLNDDKKKHPHMVHFCPDFALVVHYRNFITHKRTDGLQKLPPLLSFVGVRIEQAPFNYIPLLEMYNGNLRNWTNDKLGEAVAADAYNVGTKELPFLAEQVKVAKDNFEDGLKATLGKMTGLGPEASGKMNYDALKMRLMQMLEAMAVRRAQFEGLLTALQKNRDENIKDLKVKYQFKDRSREFKLVDKMFSDDAMQAGVFYLPPIPTGVLKGRDKPEKEERTPAKLCENFKDPLARSFELNLNSMGITGVDMVNLMVQVKATRDMLALAKWTLDKRSDACNSIDSVFTSDPFKRLINKGEYLDVKRSGISNFFSSFDPPKDVLKHEIEKFEEAIDDVEEKIEKREKDIVDLQKLLKGEYEKFHALLQKYEQAKSDTGIELEISASDANYAPAILDPLSDLTPLNAEAGD